MMWNFIVSWHNPNATAISYTFYGSYKTNIQLFMRDLQVLIVFHYRQKTLLFSYAMYEVWLLKTRMAQQKYSNYTFYTPAAYYDFFIVRSSVVWKLLRNFPFLACITSKVSKRALFRSQRVLNLTNKECVYQSETDSLIALMQNPEVIFLQIQLLLPFSFSRLAQSFNNVAY